MRPVRVALWSLLILLVSVVLGLTGIFHLFFYLLILALMLGPFVLIFIIVAIVRFAGNHGVADRIESWLWNKSDLGLNEKQTLILVSSLAILGLFLGYAIHSHRSYHIFLDHILAIRICE